MHPPVPMRPRIRARGAKLRRVLRPVALAAAISLVGCSETVIRGEGGPRSAPPITHVVLIELADPSQAAELERDCNEMLPRIPSVTLYGCGRPVDIGRGTVDGDYTLGLIVGYESERGYREYLDHPLHQQLVEKWRPRWTRIRIYDIGNDAQR